jgi:hypothetical protein
MLQNGAHTLAHALPSNYDMCHSNPSFSITLLPTVSFPLSLTIECTLKFLKVSSLQTTRTALPARTFVPLLGRFVITWRVLDGRA